MSSNLAGADVFSKLSPACFKSLHLLQWISFIFIFMKYNLILDTSGVKGVVALTLENQIVFESIWWIEEEASSKMEQEIEKAFANLKISPCQIRLIAVAEGPGFFSRTRKAVAFAQGFSFTKNIPLIGFSSLEGYIPEYEGAFFSALELRLKEMFIWKRERRGKEVIALEPPRLCLKEEVYQEGLLLVGPRFLEPYPHILALNPSVSHLQKVVNKKFKERGINQEFSINYLKPAF